MARRRSRASRRLSRERAGPSRTLRCDPEQRPSPDPSRRPRDQATAGRDPAHHDEAPRTVRSCVPRRHSRHRPRAIDPRRRRRRNGSRADRGGRPPSTARRPDGPSFASPPSRSTRRPRGGPHPPCCGAGWVAMRYETAKAFRIALEQRLKNEAQATGIALLRLLKRVAFERFLARLATSESSGWVLKGAFALERGSPHAGTRRCHRIPRCPLHGSRRPRWPPVRAVPSRCRVQRNHADSGGAAFRRERAGVRRRRRAAAAGCFTRAARRREAPRLHRRLRKRPAREHPSQGSRQSKLIPAHPRDFRHWCLKSERISEAVGTAPETENASCSQFLRWS